MKRLILTISVLISCFMPTMALAASADNQLFSACSQASNSAFCSGKGTTDPHPVIHIINVTANLFALLTGIAAVILIIVSGITMAASGGSQEAVANSRKRITSAVIGLIIVILAWTIVRFITDKVIQ